MNRIGHSPRAGHRSRRLHGRRDAIATGIVALPHGVGPAGTERAPLPDTPRRLRPPSSRSGRPASSPTRLGDRIWVVNADGTDAHELLPNVPGSQSPLAWSGDGSRLLYGRGTQVGSR